jgi:transcriptional regulator of acetoin/glycerol metabolism
MQFSKIKEETISLIRSWDRSKSFGVDPLYVDNDLLTGGELEDRKDRLRDLFHTSSSILDNLYKQLKDTPFMILISDADGYILKSWGNSPFIDRARKVWLDAGANWHEKVKGTNAIGTALVEKKPISVVGEQHYCQENHFLCCYAAPLYSPTGELLGVLDVSGDVRRHQAHTMGMVIAAAQACQAHLLLESAKRELTLCIQETDAIIDGYGQPLISVDRDGMITRINQDASRILGLPPEKCIGQHLSRWFSRKDIDEILSAKGPSFVEPKLKADSSGGEKIKKWIVRPVRDQRDRVIRTVLSPKPLERKEQIQKVNVQEVKEQNPSRESGIICNCPKAKEVFRLASVVAPTNATILIQGETGTGKEIIAQSIHRTSGRSGPLVVVNCAAIPESLIESELFGYEKGAFTGAKSEGHQGKFEAADGGTLFLDEIGELSLASQAALLRVLEEKRVTRIGSHRSKPVNVRIIAATNRILSKEVEENRFRADLYYRLCEIELFLPPLRERSDLFDLADHFLGQMAKELGVPHISLDQVAREKIAGYSWPGNIRELRQVLRQAAYQACLLRQTSTITVQDISLPREKGLHSSLHSKSGLWNQQEAETIKMAIQKTRGNLSEAARLLGISRTTLYRKLNQYPQVREMRKRVLKS